MLTAGRLTLSEAADQLREALSLRLIKPTGSNSSVTEHPQAEAFRMESTQGPTCRWPIASVEDVVGTFCCRVRASLGLRLRYHSLFGATQQPSANAPALPAVFQPVFPECCGDDPGTEQSTPRPTMNAASRLLVEMKSSLGTSPACPPPLYCSLCTEAWFLTSHLCSSSTRRSVAGRRRRAGPNVALDGQTAPFAPSAATGT